MNKFLCFLLVAFCLTNNAVAAQIRLPQLVADGMVLQRNAETTVWGWASPGEAITMQFDGKKQRAKTDASGEWRFTLPPRPAGGPHTIMLTGKNEVTISDVLFGDVWLCTGQSNMVHQMKLHRILYAEDIAKAQYPEIRHFAVPTTPVLTGPAEDFTGGKWLSATPENVRDFTAVGYFFALDLYERYRVPIGLINASVGGTPIEAWTSEAGLKEFPGLSETVLQNKDTAYVNGVNRRANARRANTPPREIRENSSLPWYAENLNTEYNWRPINIPGYWEDQGVGDLNGSVWYRREVELPAGMASKEAEVFLGRIVDADELFINGTRVGGTGYQYPQRRYQVPAGVLRAGTNVFAVKVTNYGGKGGFVPDRPYEIHTSTDTVDLKGTWHYRVKTVFPSNRLPGPRRISAQHQPAALFNGMLAPASNYAIKGVLWYQGESNAGRPGNYGALQAAQIADFRNRWGGEDLPFFFVQLPGFQDYAYAPTESNWAEMREAQRETLALPNTGMAIAIDLGEWNDIHPDNKKDVGLRLARLARRQVYGERELVASGPLPTTTELKDGKVTVFFAETGSGLVSRDGEALREFALAGYDGEFRWAEARIVGNAVEVSHPEIESPRYLRYAWADNPRINLYNKEGLPASPFELSVGPAQPPLWRGKKAAVVLTYDDALNVHLDNALPVLDQLGLKATFYLSAASPGSKNRLRDWRRAGDNGHELGNHTLYHPCDASTPGREWVATEQDLSKYTTARLVNEVEMTNVFLESLDGKKERTFAYPCGDTKTGEGSFVDAISAEFVASRGVRGQLNSSETVDLQNVNAYVVDGHTAEEMIAWVRDAEAENALVVLLFHGIGGEHSLNVSLEAHRELLEYLAENEDRLWVTTMLEAAKHLKTIK